jgi:hypothetical protein
MNKVGGKGDGSEEKKRDGGKKKQREWRRDTVIHKK